MEGKVRYWGSCWQEHWWTIDFSGLPVGNYTLIITGDKTTRIEDMEFSVDEFLLWKETIQSVVYDQFEERASRAKDRNGWKDCGSNLREACSHAASIIGLCDFAHQGVDWIASEDYSRLIRQIIQGCEYLCLLQDKASMLDLPTGSFVHELVDSPRLIPSDAPQCALALAYGSRMVFDREPKLSKKFLDRAKQAYEFLSSRPASATVEHFSHDNHGAPEEYQPPQELMTRDLLLQMWLNLELWISGGNPHYQQEAVRLADSVLNRQIPESHPEGEFFGHFRTFSDSPFTEKANIHHHVGHDTGGIFPHMLLPLIQMYKRWRHLPDASRWRQAIFDFAYGFLVPACKSNPFNLLPSGYFTGEGLLAFCGPWHGINISYTWIAVLASELESITEDPVFREIAVGNIQWIAGLNSGLHAGMFDSCYCFNPVIPDGEVHPYSMIEGIGIRSTIGWSGIKGSIVNGFSVNPQFKMTVPSKKENDGPRQFTDEDWIPPAGGWASALAHLRSNLFFLKRVEGRTNNQSQGAESHAS